MADLTVCVTTFNRPEMLRECLDSVVPQVAETGARLVVLDNCSDTDNAAIVCRHEESCDLLFVRHPRNLGAVGNGRFAMSECAKTEFGMIFHDDDLMAPGLLGRQLRLLMDDGELLFVATGMAPFRSGERPGFDVFREPETGTQRYSNAAGLTRAILRGAPIHLGSVMYRSRVFASAEHDEKAYGGINDRPFLLAIARLGPVARICEPLAYYRQHEGQDSQNLDLSPNHVINLAVAYRDALLCDVMPGDEWLFYSWSARALPSGFARLAHANRPSVLRCCLKARRMGAFRFTYLRRSHIGDALDEMGIWWAVGLVEPARGARLARNRLNLSSGAGQQVGGSR